MAGSMLTLEHILEKKRNRPRSTIVEELVKLGDVDSLTKLKLKIVSKCQENESFPKGGLYSRRKPKGQSRFCSLEERLATDICLLCEFLDSGVVTSEIKNMFKNHDDNSETSSSQEATSETQYVYSPPEVIEKTPLNSLNSSVVHRSSGWSGLKSQVATLQSGYILFRETVTLDISQIQKLNV